MSTGSHRPVEQPGLRISEAEIPDLRFRISEAEIPDLRSGDPRSSIQTIRHVSISSRSEQPTATIGNFLLHVGADITLTPSSWLRTGTTMLHYAARYDRTGYLIHRLCCLVNHGDSSADSEAKNPFAQVDAKGNTIVQTALMYGNQLGFQVLSSFNPSSRTVSDPTPRSSHDLWSPEVDSRESEVQPPTSILI